MISSKRYLVTGGAGFIGSHLCQTLLENGASVTVIDDLSTGCWSNVAPLEKHEKFRAVIASAEDAKLMNEEIPKHDFVYHLASAVGVQLIIDRPVETVQRIVRTTDTILDSCARYRKPILLTSTSEVYGKSENVPFSEEDDTVMGPTSKRRWAYAGAKALDEFLVLAHYHQSSLPVYIVRLFNTVGPRQSGQYGMVLPRFIASALKNEPIRVFGDGTQRRCFCSVFDVVQGLIALPSAPEAVGQVVNLGSREEISMNELAKKIVTQLDSRSEIQHIPYEQAYGPGFDDMMRRVPNLTRAERWIRWSPRYTLTDIITQITDV